MKVVSLTDRQVVFAVMGPNPGLIPEVPLVLIFSTPQDMMSIY